MDSLTQAALGAAIGESLLGRRIGYRGALLGAGVATIPDLDVIGYLFVSKMRMLEIHRGFSHSFLFTILMSVVLTICFSKFKWTSHIDRGRVWWFAWLSLVTHILLDAFTAYGTQLYLPFSNLRVSWDSINVVDPVFTIPLLLGVGISLFIPLKSRWRSIPNLIGLILSVSYLISTLFVKSNIESQLKVDLKNEQIEWYQIRTIPVGFAGQQWYGLAKTNDEIYMRKYHLQKGANSELWSFPIHEAYFGMIDAERAEKMRWFAKDFYTLQQVQDTLRIYNLQVDMRGVVQEGDYRAPTVGYFQFYPDQNGNVKFDSGSINVRSE